MGSYSPLQFPIEVGNAQPLRDLATILQQVQQVTGANRITMRTFQEELAGAAAKSVNLAQALTKVEQETRKGIPAIANMASTMRLLISEQDKVTASAAREAAAQERAAASFARAQAVRLAAATKAAASQSSAGLGLAAGVSGRVGFGLVGNAIGVPGLGFAGANIARFLGPAGIGAGVGLITAFAVTKAFDYAEKAARDIEKLGIELGVSSKEADKFSIAASLSGAKVSDLASAAAHLSSALEDPAGSGRKVVETLAALGISATDVNDKLKAPGILLQEIFEHLQKIPDKAVQSAEAIRLLGSAAKDLSRYYSDFKATNEAATKLQIVSNEDIDRLSRAEDSIGRLVTKMKEYLLLFTSKQLEARDNLTGLFSPGLSIFDIFNKARGGPEAGAHPGGYPQAAAPPNAAALGLRKYIGGIVDPDTLSRNVNDAKREYDKIRETPVNDNITDAAAAERRAAIAAAKSKYDSAVSAQQAFRKGPHEQSELETYLGSLGAKDEPGFGVVAQGENQIRKLGLGSRFVPVGDGTYTNAGLIRLATSTRGLEEQQKHLATLLRPESDKKLQDFYIEAFQRAGGVGDADVKSPEELQRQTTGGLTNFDKQTLERARKAHEVELKLYEDETKAKVSQVGYGNDARSISLNRIIAGKSAGGPEEAREVMAKQLADAQTISDIQTNSDNKHLTQQEKELINSKALTELEERRNKIATEYHNKILEAQAAQEQSFDKTFTSAALALQGGPNKARQFGIGLGHQFESKILENVGGAVYNNGGQSALNALHIPDSSPDFLKQLLQGTFLGAKGHKDDPATATKDNTTATIDNTNATLGLLSALTGQPTASVPGGSLSLPGLGDATPFGFSNFGSGTGVSPILATVLKAAGVPANQVSAIVSGVGSAVSSGNNLYSLLSGGPGGSSYDGAPYASPSAYSGSGGGYNPLGIGATGLSDPLGLGGGTGVIGTDTARLAVPTTSTDLAKTASTVGGGLTSLAKVFSGYNSLQTGTSSANSKNPFSVLFGNHSPGEDDTTGQWNSPVTLGQQIGAGIGIAGAAFGVFSGASQIAKGGVSNDIGGIGKIAGSLAAVAGPAAPIFAGVAAVATIVSAVLGDPKVRRQTAINQSLASDQFYAPTAINATVGFGGGFTDYNRFGGVRTSSLSPYPQVQEPYYLFNQKTYVPGQVTSPFGGDYPGAPGTGPAGQGAAGTPPGFYGPSTAPVTIHNWNISTMDSGSFSDYAQKNHEAFAAAVTTNINNGSGGIVNTLRQRL